MINDNDFETYFYLSPNRLIVSVFQKDLTKKIFNREILINENLNLLNFEEVQNFLEKNISEIERKTQNFLNDICLIVDYNDMLSVDISFKHNNEGLELKKKDLHYLLKDAKQQIKKYYNDKLIVHFVIKNYFLDKINYSYFPVNQKCNNFILELKFICFSKEMIKRLEGIFQKHHISISKIICGKYIKDFFKKSEMDYCEMALNIRNGCNDREVLLIPKTEEKKGFFEKFFNFFG